MAKNKDGSYTLNYYTGESIQLYFDGNNIVFLDDSEGTYAYKPNYELSFVPDDEEDTYDDNGEYMEVDVDSLLRNPNDYVNKRITLIVKIVYQLGDSKTEYYAFPAYYEVLGSGDASWEHWATISNPIIVVNKTGASSRWLDDDVMQVYGKFLGMEEYEGAGGSTDIPTMDVYRSVLVN